MGKLRETSKKWVLSLGFDFLREVKETNEKKRIKTNKIEMLSGRIQWARYWLQKKGKAHKVWFSFHVFYFSSLVTIRI